ncbi:YncE family protein [Lysinibacter cavernae]|uniref:YVTN family beta-propeller protein n=1 Tax=Lysinibacter cavernae TaxID=1640652 RepID=A0A7X5QYS3_9MICO|nr:YncE family protein [Lysinibacter cavernae]NIH52456.1 YVTN family beta-propeller protein [Lysinibacter cavernae]
MAHAPSSNSRQQKLCPERAGRRRIKRWMLGTALMSVFASLLLAPVASTTTAAYTAQSNTVATKFYLNIPKYSFREIPLPTKGFRIAVNTRTNQVYASDYGYNLHIIDGATARVTQTVTVPGNTSYSVTVDEANGQIFMASTRGRNFYRFPVSNPADFAASPATYGFARGIIINPNTRKVWIHSDAILARVNGATMVEEARVSVPGAIQSSIALDSSNSTLYIANNDVANTVSVYNGLTLAITKTIPVGVNPVGLEFNPTTKQLYVANSGANSVSVVNTTTGAVIKTIPVGISPSNVAINPKTNKIFVTHASASGVYIIDGATQTVEDVLATPNNAHSSAAAVNTVTGSVYVVASERVYEVTPRP